MNAIPWTLVKETPISNLRSEQHAAAHDRILLEQLRACYCHTPGAILGGPMAVPLFVFLLWDNIDPNILIGWGLVTLLTHMAGGAILHYGFRKDAHPERNVRKWNHALYILAAALGACWGSIGLLFFTPELMNIQLIIYLWIYGAAAFGALAMVAIHQGFLAFTVPLLTPIFITSCLQMDLLYAGLGASTAIYFAFLTYFSKINNTTMVDYLRTRFANIDLAEELAGKNKVIEKAGRDKSQFFAAASHDLRQPLHAQVLFVAELKARTKDADCLEIIAYLEASIDSMRAMYDQMLDISRLDAGVIERRAEVFQVSQVLKRLKTEFHAQMTQKGLCFRVVESRYHILSDPMLLENMLRNLLSNALRYTNTGCVLIGCRYRNDRLVIEVRDSGIGIPTEQQKNIFEEFIQLGNPERDREKGLGLGLSIVTRLSKLLNHPLSLTSFTGQGTTFGIEVPLAQCAPKNSPTLLDILPAADLSGMAVLVIDDDAGILKATSSLLTRWGCITQTASSDEHALESLSESAFKPDVIIADYRLRDSKTGLQAIARIREYLDRSVPAILITGDTAPERLRETISSGFMLLHKPIQPALLSDLLNQIRKL